MMSVLNYINENDCINAICVFLGALLIKSNPDHLLVMFNVPDAVLLYVAEIICQQSLYKRFSLLWITRIYLCEPRCEKYMAVNFGGSFTVYFTSYSLMPNYNISL